MPLGGTYSTGTITVTNGLSTATGSGTAWLLAELEQGDFVSLNGLIAPVKSFDSDADLTFYRGWPGSTVAGAAYDIVKISWLRYDPSVTQEQLREFLSFIKDTPVIYSVTGTPDPGLGEDGNFALNASGAPWIFWTKITGSWVSLGSPVGITAKGVWSGGAAYAQNEWVEYGGDAYLAVQPGTNHQPDVSPTYWAKIGAKGDTGPAPVISGTSVSSVTVGLGSKSFTTQAGIAWTIGQRLRVSNNAGTLVMSGPVASYSGTALTLTVDDVAGTSGTGSSWNISIAGEKGSQGIQGVQGPQGNTGPAPALSGTSATSVAAGLGSRSFITQSGIAWSLGQRLLATSADLAIELSGLLTAYSGTSLTLNVDQARGAGNAASWTIAIGGEQGTQGPTGGTGQTGAKGDAGPAPVLSAVSISAVPVSEGPKAFAVPAELQFSGGQPVVMADPANANVMFGYVTSYSGTTLNVNVVMVVRGSGTHSSWTINSCGVPGVQGTQGTQGQGLAYGASGTLAQRATSDNQPQGFGYLETDTAPFQLWVKASNTTADWAGPTYVGGSAAVGDWGSFADSVTELFDYGSF